MQIFYIPQTEDDQFVQDPDVSDLPDLEASHPVPIFGEYIQCGQEVPLPRWKSPTQLAMLCRQ
jgi:hypothetical protein